MTTQKPLPTITREIPPIAASVNDDGGLDILAGGRVVATVAIVNVEDFAGVTYYDVDVRGRDYVRMIESGSALRSRTRLRQSGADQVLHYLRLPTGSDR